MRLDVVEVVAPRLEVVLEVTCEATEVLRAGDGADFGPHPPVDPASCGSLWGWIFYINGRCGLSGDEEPPFGRVDLLRAVQDLHCQQERE